MFTPVAGCLLFVAHVFGCATPSYAQSPVSEPQTQMRLPLHVLDSTPGHGITIREIRMGDAKLNFAISFLDSTDAPGGTTAAATKPPLRILFIGNSLTFYNELPRLFSRVAAAGLHRRVVVGLVSLPGGPASTIWQATDVQQVIAQLPWDVVVLQTRPMALHDSTNFNHDARVYARAAAAQHARLILWGQFRSPDAPLALQAVLDSGFAGAAAVAGATVAPVPAAWEAVRRADSTLWPRLFYSATNDHPSVLGSYLIAMVLYHTITEQSPVDLPTAVGSVSIPSREATALQHAAVTAAHHPTAVDAAGGLPPAPAPTALTEALLTHYLTFKRALNPFCDAHVAICKTALRTERTAYLMVGTEIVPFKVFDFPQLVTQDTALAALFTATQFHALQYESVQAAVYGALGVLAAHERSGMALPDATTVEGRNLALVRAHQQDLAAVGMIWKDQQ